MLTADSPPSHPPTHLGKLEKFVQVELPGPALRPCGKNLSGGGAGS